jgi:hypothetical protein
MIVQIARAPTITLATTMMTIMAVLPTLNLLDEPSLFAAAAPALAVELADAEDRTVVEDARVRESCVGVTID